MTVVRQIHQKFLLAAGVIVMIATVVVALIAIGGTGHGRADRIDHWRLAAVAHAVHLAECTQNLTGEAPETLAVARDLLIRSHAKVRGTPCQPFDPLELAQEQDEVEYTRLTVSRIRVCKDFLRPDLEPPMINDPGYPDVIYVNGPFGIAALNVPRPKAGRFCYEIDLPADAL